MRKILIGLALVIAGVVILPAAVANAASLETAGNAGELSAALANVDDGGTIQLTASFVYDDEVIIDSKNITIDLNGYTLSIDGSGSAVLSGVLVIKDHTLTVKGSGALNVIYSDIWDNKGIVVDNGTFDVANGAVVNSNGGDYDIYTNGIYASDSMVTITDGVINTDSVYATGVSNITVTEAGFTEAAGANANITVLYDVKSIWAESGSTINVLGNVLGNYKYDLACAVYAGDFSTVNISGNITFTGYYDYYGAVCADGDGEVYVGGNITVTGPEITGIYIQKGATVTVDGNINVTQTLTDEPEDYVFGIFIEKVGVGIVYVKGNIKVVGNGYGVVILSDDSSVVVDGTVTAKIFAFFDSQEIFPGDYLSVPTSHALYKEGYRLYGIAGGIFNSYLWVKGAATMFDDTENPKTSDINFALVMLASVVAVVGMVSAVVELRRNY